MDYLVIISKHNCQIHNLPLGVGQSPWSFMSRAETFEVPFPLLHSGLLAERPLPEVTGGMGRHQGHINSGGALCWPWLALRAVREGYWIGWRWWKDETPSNSYKSDHGSQQSRPASFERRDDCHSVQTWFAVGFDICSDLSGAVLMDPGCP